jgi:curved DNA-binding protein CbpA
VSGCGEGNTKQQDAVQQLANLQNEKEEQKVTTDGTFAQGKLLKDLDKDGIMDRVYIEKNRIICRLSTQQFKEMQSQEIETFNSGIREARNGFSFYIHWMRAGYENQFRYDSKTKRIQLIGMSRYEFGNAANDGSGESSVNLLTGDYVGDWNYSDEEREELIKIPTIKTKISFGKIYLEDFSEETFLGFADKCAELYHIHKEKMKMKNRIK